MSTALRLGGLLRPSPKRNLHIFLGRYHDYNQWEMIPHPALEKAGVMARVGAEKPTTMGRILRGTGLHGPENANVFKLALWNRLKQKRPQREVPTVEQLRDFTKLEMSCVWFTWSWLLFYWPMALWGSHYAAEHDHFPWVPARTDGSRGEGPFFWFLE